MSEAKTEMQIDRANFNLAFRRPWLDADGKGWVTVDGVDLPLPHPQCPVKPVLTKAQWAELDERVARAVHLRTPITRLVREKCKAYPLGTVAKTVLEYEEIPPPKPGEEQPKYTLKAMPLPFCHASFKLSDPPEQRDLAARRVGQMIEKAVLGVAGIKIDFGPLLTSASSESPIFGIVDHPARVQVAKMDNLAPDFCCLTPIAKVAGMVIALRERKFCGPYLVVHGNGWDHYLDGDFSPSGVYEFDKRGSYTQTVRQRMREIPNVIDVVRADLLMESHSYDLVVVQLDASVIQMVDGLLPTVVQWTSEGEFKVMAISWPRIKTNMEGVSGIAVAA